jgi:hypothetical protein
LVRGSAEVGVEAKPPAFKVIVESSLCACFLQAAADEGNLAPRNHTFSGRNPHLQR